MPSFRSRPVVIQAERLVKSTVINTLEGNMKGNIGDWLIIGTKGESYPCKDDVFRQKYEPIDEEGKAALSEYIENEPEFVSIRFPGVT